MTQPQAQQDRFPNNKDRKGKIFTDQWMLALQARKAKNEPPMGSELGSPSLARTDLGLMVRFSLRSEFRPLFPIAGRGTVKNIAHASIPPQHPVASLIMQEEELSPFQISFPPTEVAAQEPNLFQGELQTAAIGGSKKAAQRRATQLQTNTIDGGTLPIQEVLDGDGVIRGINLCRIAS